MQNKTKHQRKPDHQVQFHDLQDETEQELSYSNGDTFYDSVAYLPNNDPIKEDNTILANMTQRKALPPGHLQRFLSSSNTTGDSNLSTTS